jgi:hypothetical protein
LGDVRNVGESSSNPGDGTDQRVQSLMFMMMVMMVMMSVQLSLCAQWVAELRCTSMNEN